jgi:hypothetical protein
MLSRSSVALSLLCVLSGSAATGDCQIVATGTRQSPSQPRTIAGVVINGVTGWPIARALVQAGQHAMLTDAEGRFELRGVTEPDVALFATKPGYFGENISPLIPSMPAAESQAGPVEVRLVPEAILSGLVTDGSGVPLEGITVQLRTLTTSNGLKHWDQRVTTRTNAEGEFRFAELRAGEYALQTAVKLDGPIEGEAAAGYASVDYPVLGANEAGALQLHPGDHLEADMSTRLEKLYPVSGVINGLPESASLSFTVRTAEGLETNAAFRQNPQTGEFRILLPSGSLEVRAHAYAAPANHGIVGEPAQQLIARHLVTIAQGPVSGLSMTLEPMATLPVEVAEEHTTKLQSGGQPLDPPDVSQMNIRLLPGEADAAHMTYSVQRLGNGANPVQVRQGSGPPLIRDLPPGQYFLQAQPQQPWYIASAFCGGTDLTREWLSITGSAAGCMLRLVLRDDIASLKFSVSDAKGDRATPAFIYFVPLDNLTRDVLMLSTGPEGKGSMDMPPGQYLLLATRHGAQLQLAFRDPESLRRYEAEGRRIDLTPGGNAEVRLDVIAGEP